MAHRPLNRALRFIHRLAGLPVGGDRTDRQLLESFAEHGDQPSFDELVRRHGPLVWGVCRRVLQNEHDADDAFQATFLVLSRKAASISWHESVKHWLYEVAYRIALRGRASRDRRRAQERQAAACRTEIPAEVSWRDVQLALDEELHRLPAKYRAPLLLCYLEGQTQEEAARQLGSSTGALRGRLWRARDLLRERLARRGLELSAVILAAMLAESAPAAVPGTLLTATVQAGTQFAAGQATGDLVSARALELTQGVLQAMFVTKLKLTAAIVLSLGLLATAGGLIAQRALADRSVRAATAEAPQRSASQAADQAPKKEAPPVIGLVKAIDTNKSSVTLAPYGKAKEAAEETFALAREVKVTLDDGTALKLTDIAAGIYVWATPSDDKKTVTALRAMRPADSGAVKAVDADKKSITIAGRGGERAFAVADDAKIVISSKESKLSDVKEGMQVSLRLSLDKKTVLSIQVGTGSSTSKPKDNK